MLIILSSLLAKPVLKLLALTITASIITLLPINLAGAASSTVIINAVYYDTYPSGEPDEAFQLFNVSVGPIDLTNWTVTDNEATGKDWSGTSINPYGQGFILATHKFS